MARSRSVPLTLTKVKEMLRRERRKNRRLREVIDGLRGQIAEHRRDLDLQFTRLAQLQAELDALKQSIRR
jgi:chromosome condensin MukBEF ATPase and DNA-binding subunit MukB